MGSYSRTASKGKVREMSCILGIEQSCDECRMCRNEEKKQTNADRIRSMSNEELAEFLSDVKYDGIHYKEGQEYPINWKVWEAWLRSEAGK